LGAAPGIPRQRAYRQRDNRLARSIKFTAGAEGKLDDRITSANELGSDRAIVPVQIIGDQDGPWDRAAWKNDAFYGNVLVAFSGPM
jgi:hypothetical protein